MASDGWNYVIRVQTITNGAGGAGDQTWPVLTSTDSEVEIFQMDVTNGDTLARNVSAVVDDATTTIATLLAASSLNAAAITRWPYVGGAFAAAGNNPEAAAPLHIGNGARVLWTIAAVAASQDTTFAIRFRFRGQMPTIIPTGASTPSTGVETIVRW